MEGTSLGSGGDKQLVCTLCGQPFLFTVGEQEFYRQRGFLHEPKKCKPCRDREKQSGNRKRSENPASQSFEVVCSTCQKTTRVPFRPIPGKPVYCRDCYLQIKRNQ
ncbi:MAG: zinc-ribbon domain containing protein [Candidatus Tectomicrobia bacterium]|uniref:Zinc-ribbon domain containing protein n=1 Tax=Tectimicrobiota bacterium TaxID=2528274 RepID=A0A932M0J9_UNCTE|nr:zinc-ribbon domain containing protein [Candidatus Tectomicrobia bacterium]